MSETSKPTKQSKDIFVKPDGEVVDKEYIKLSKILHNYAIRINKSVLYGDYMEDLYQEAWCKIIKEIPNVLARRGIIETQYAVRIGQNAMLAYFNNKINKHQVELDPYTNDIFNEEMNSNKDRFQLNTEKAKLEFNVSKNKLPLEDCISLRVSIENIILNLPKDDRCRNLLLMKYIKEFDGTSEVLLKEYEDFYNSCDKEKQEILNSMDENFTHNKAYKCLGIRSTDNCTTQIRKGIKDLLQDLRYYYGERLY